MAADLLTKDLIAYDPLSEITRKERTSLLGLSMIGIALVKVPLVPEKLAILGIEFAKVQQSTFVSLYALVIGYYLLAFCVYAFTDYVAWRRQEVITLAEYEVQVNERSETGTLKGKSSNPDSDTKFQSKRVPRDNPSYVGFASYWLAFSAARFRATFEFLLPILFATYALAVLMTYS